MSYDIALLSASLANAAESDYVRLAADWIARGDLTSSEPPMTGTPIVDALVAAALAYRCGLDGVPVPDWTRQSERLLPSFWHPGPDAFFGYSLAHTPIAFLLRGIIVEQDSLACV